jgi:hypothetical protein
LNLNRAGATAAQNYYGLVRPEMQFRNAYRGLQQQLTNTQMGLAQLTDPATGLPVTGHTPVFLNTGGYFLNLTGGHAGMAGAAGLRGGAATGGGAYGMGTGTGYGMGAGTGGTPGFQTYQGGGGRGGPGIRR